MRVLFIAPYVPSLIRVRPFHFVRELARQGHEVVVLATDNPRAQEDVEALGPYTQHVEVVPLRPYAVLRSCAVAALRGEPLQSAVCHSPALEARLAALLSNPRHAPFDVVHVEHLRAARLRHRLPPGLPVVFDTVDSISLLLERTLRSSHSLRQRAIALAELHRTRGFEARMLARFDRVAVTSPDDARVFRALAPTAAVTIIPNGVDLDAFRPLEGPREPATIVFSGKMSYHANVTAALYFARHIFPLIRAARPDARLRIVGSRPPEVIQRLAQDPAIEVTGFVPNLSEAVGRATIAVCPVTVKVGIQNKVLEAMALRVPVVATAAGAEGLLAEPGRDLLVADDHDPGAFAREVCRLLDDPDLAAQIAAAGRTYVETHHQWEDATRRLETLYQEAIRRSTGY